MANLSKGIRIGVIAAIAAGLGALIFYSERSRPADAAPEYPLKVCVMDFTTADIAGQQRFLNVRNEPIEVPQLSLLTNADRLTINGVMLGAVKMIEAADAAATNAANRNAQIQDNEFNRAKALELYNTVVKGPSRPTVIGAEYLSSYLGNCGNGKIFSVSEAGPVAAEVEKLQSENLRPRDFSARLARAAGVRYLIYGTVADLRVKTGNSEAYGIVSGSTDFELDVLVRVIDLATGGTAFSGVYTGRRSDQRPFGETTMDNNVFQDLMKQALKEAAAGICSRFSPEPVRTESRAANPPQTAAAQPAAELNAATVQPDVRPTAAAAQPGSTTAGNTPESTESPKPTAPEPAAPEKYLAIARPAALNGVKPEEVDFIWGMLESSAGKGFKLVSRAALNQMAEELKLTAGGWVDLDSARKAQLRKLKGVGSILVSEIGRQGNRLNISMRIIDASTGEIDMDKRISRTVNDAEDLGNQLKYMLDKMFNPSQPAAALLVARVTAPGAPAYLADYFTTRLESDLLDGGADLLNMDSVAGILKDNGIGDPGNVPASAYIRIGEVLGVGIIIQPTVSRFSLRLEEKYIESSQRTVKLYIGNIDGDVSIYSAENGRRLGRVIFEKQFDLRKLPTDLTKEWTGEDYGKYMLKELLPEIGRDVLIKLNQGK